MKKIVPILLVMLVMLTGCSKSTKCKCTLVNNPDEVLLVDTDNGLPCRKITKLGYERLLEGQLIRDLEEVTCVEDKD